MRRLGLYGPAHLSTDSAIRLCRASREPLWFETDRTSVDPDALRAALGPMLRHAEKRTPDERSRYVDPFVEVDAEVDRSARERYAAWAARELT